MKISQIGTLTFLMCGRWLRACRQLAGTPFRKDRRPRAVLYLPIVAAFRVGPLLLLTLPATLLWPVAAAVLETEDQGLSPALAAPAGPLRVNQLSPG